MDAGFPFFGKIVVSDDEERRMLRLSKKGCLDRNDRGMKRKNFLISGTCIGFLTINCLGENRSIDGSGNSKDDRGAAGQPFSRMAAPDYTDGSNEPGGLGRPSPREISNQLCAQEGSVPNRRRGTDFLWQWGQFIDHDITQAVADTDEFHGILVTDPNDLLSPMIPMMRSRYEMDGDGVRQQTNAITSFLDGSMIYGSDNERAMALRAVTGGRMKVDQDQLLPMNDLGLVMDMGEGGALEDLRLAGDTRANEQPGLTALHTIFVREHNRLAGELAAANPGWNDEELYQRARKLNGAILQAITYREWLPALIGDFAPPLTELAYDSEVDPAISNEFAAGIFRLGHTLVSPKLMRVRNDGFLDSPASVGMRDAFFAPEGMGNESSLAHLLKGMACQQHQDADLAMSDDLRNFLFGNPGEGGLDLAALNVQRGREHGLPSYVAMREAMGLTVPSEFSEITGNAELATKLENLYGTPGAIDLWIGALAEDHAGNSGLGLVNSVVIAEEFRRIANGDAFFYRWDDDLNADDMEMLEASTLSKVITRNTALDSLQENVFFLSPTQSEPTLAIRVVDSGKMVALSFMQEPGFQYSILSGQAPGHWTKPADTEDLVGDDTSYRVSVLKPAGNDGDHRFYQLVRSIK